MPGAQPAVRRAGKVPSLGWGVLWCPVPLVKVTAGAVLIRPCSVSCLAVQSDVCLGKGVGRAGRQEDSGGSREGRKPSKAHLGNAEGR